MKQVTFTSENFNKETPKIIKNAYRALMFLTALWILAIEPRVNIPLMVAHNIDVWSSISTYAVYLFCQYFGYKCPDLPPGAPGADKLTENKPVQNASSTN